MDYKSAMAYIDEIFADFKQGLPEGIPDEILKKYLIAVLTF